MTTSENMGLVLPQISDLISSTIPSLATNFSDIDTEFSNRAFNVTWYGAKGDGATDSTTGINNAIKAAIKAGGGIVFFPVGIYVVTSPINALANQGDTPLQLVGSGATPPDNYSFGGGSVISANFSSVSGYTSGKIPVIDISGSHFTKLKDLRIESSNTGAQIGVLMGMLQNGSVAHNQTLENVEIAIPTNSGAMTTADNNFVGLGSVGVYNAGAELCNFHNLSVRADVPMVFTQSNLCAVTSPSSLSSNPNTMSQIHLSGACQLWAYGGGQIPAPYTACAVLLDGVHDFFMTSYLYSSSSSSGYAIQTKNVCQSLMLRGNIEGSPFHAIRATNQLYNCDIAINIYSDTTHPLCDLGGNALVLSTLRTFQSSEGSSQDIFSASDYAVGCIFQILSAQSLGITGAHVQDCHVLSNKTTGWIGNTITTPSLPAATGSTNTVYNNNPFPIQIYLNGGSDIHVLDMLGNDASLPGTPTLVFLECGEGIYFETTIPTSWFWRRG